MKKLKTAVSMLALSITSINQASAQLTGSVVGNITGLGNAIENVQVCAGSLCDVTDTNGAYIVTGLDPESVYYLTATDLTSVFATERFDSWNDFDPSGATQIQVVAGEMRFIPFYLEQRGSLGGLVHFNTTPIPDVEVCAAWGNPDLPGEFGCDTTNELGQYHIDFPFFGDFVVEWLPPSDYLSGMTDSTTTGVTIQANQQTIVDIPLIYSGVSCGGLPITVDLAAGQAPTNGSDVIYGTNGPDIINAIAGNDTICGRGGNDIINGGGGIDTIFGGSGDDRLGGQGGDDSLYGQGGDDRLNGGAGDDNLFGGDGNDDLRGQGGDDTMLGQGGVDQFFGGSGNDTIDVGQGGNLGTGQVVRGGGNNDIIIGSNGDDELDGGAGLDELHGGAGNDILRGSDGADELFGDSGEDWLEGGGSNDLLYGGDGDDLLRGGLGNDELFGQAGDDTLDGQGGTDICNGGQTDEADGDRLVISTTCEVIIDIP